MSEKEHEVIDRISSKLNRLTERQLNYFLWYTEGASDMKEELEAEKKADEE